MVPGTERATGRAVALVALVLLVGVALRGYLPGDDPADDQPGDNTTAMVAVMALLAAAVAIVVIAIVATLRRPQSSAPSHHPLPKRPSGERWRLSWRLILIALAVLLAWLVVVVLLAQLTAGFETPMPQTTPTTSPPTATPTPSPPPPPTPTQDESNLFWFMFAATGLMLVLLVIGMVINLRRNRRPVQAPPVFAEPAEPDGEPAPPPLAVAAERGLAEMGDLSREPREAIIACYAAMEDALAEAPGAVPLESDTPTEVLARAVSNHAIQAGTATDLVELFAEARFSPHVMNEGHRETAVRALQQVLAELRSLA